VFNSIASEVKKFEAMIAAKAQGTAKKPPHPPRRPNRACKITLANPTPTTSAPNIIELAAKTHRNTGLLVDIEVDQPIQTTTHKPPVEQPIERNKEGPSIKRQTTRRQRVVAYVGGKGKERMPPAAAAETESVSDEFDDLTEMESADEILERQIAMITTNVQKGKST
jgi:hypothetical protein